MTLAERLRGTPETDAFSAFMMVGIPAAAQGTHITWRKFARSLERRLREAADRIAELEKDRSDLIQQRDFYADTSPAASGSEAQAQDAERYRWIRNQNGYVTHADPVKCDCTIDAAIAASIRG